MFNSGPERMGWCGIMAVWFLVILLLVVLAVSFFFPFDYGILLITWLACVTVAFVVSAGSFAVAAWLVKQEIFPDKQPEWLIIKFLASLIGAVICMIFFSFLLFLYLF